MLLYDFSVLCYLFFLLQQLHLVSNPLKEVSTFEEFLEQDFFIIWSDITILIQPTLSKY